MTAPLTAADTRLDPRLTRAFRRQRWRAPVVPPVPGCAGMSAPVITGYTAQIGGPPIHCAQGIEDDRAWFARHHGRNHRLRPPLGGERDALEAQRAALSIPRSSQPCVIVRQVEPGARIRLYGFVRRWPLNSEGEAAALLAEMAEANNGRVELIEAAVREGRL
jgi:hypothetical protein